MSTYSDAQIAELLADRAERDRLRAIVALAAAAEYEYFHPFTGDGDLVVKMARLREALAEARPR
jgi:hypothetical protein